MSEQPVAQELQLLPQPTPEVQLPDGPVQPPPPPPPPPNSINTLHSFKSKLQEYTQKSTLQLPVYQTIKEGSQHAPQFRCTVFVDGKSYKSPSTFPQRKLAEQDAARVALDDVIQKIKVDGRPFVCEDTTFCKSILNEYAVKMHVGKPIYHTTQQQGILPIFVSLVTFNGVSYKGAIGRNKKESEQLAARAAILSILDSETTQTITEIIKSKHKLYVALSKVKDNGSAAAPQPAVNTGEGPVVLLNKWNEAKANGIDINQPLSGISQSSLGDLAKIQAVLESHHAFKKPRPESPSVEIALPISFVPAGFEQLQLSSPLLRLPSASLQLPSTSGVKRSRKSKRKAKKRLEVDKQMPTAALPLQQIFPCSVTQ